VRLSLPRRDAVVLSLDFAHCTGDPGLDRFYSPLVMIDNRNHPSYKRQAAL
jgi:hypothetical protein